MPIEQGDYRELKAFERVMDSGLLGILPSYAGRILLLLVRHANFPSGWSWPGRSRMERVIGLNSEYQMRGVALLAKLGLICKWGHMKTKGKPGIAYLLDLGVPVEQVPSDSFSLKQLLDYIRREVRGSTYRLLEANLSTTIGQPLDYIEIKKVITLKNPKEPSFDSFKHKGQKDISKRQEEEKKDVYKGQEELLKDALASAGRIINSEAVAYYKAVLLPHQFSDYRKAALKNWKDAGRYFD